MKILNLYFGLILILISANTFSAVENRCDDLGINCVCSEPANTDTLVLDKTTEGLNPADTISSDKECSVNGLVGSAMSGLFSEINQITTGNNPSVLAKIPASTISNYARGVDGHTVNWFFGAKDIDTIKPYPKARTAFRWYVYHSSSAVAGEADFEFKGDASCANTKWARLGSTDSGIQADGGINFTFYTLWSWNKGANILKEANCCWTGPPAIDYDGNQYAYSPVGKTAGGWKTYLRGKWWRVEIVMTNRGANNVAPNGTVLQMFMKNITDDSPEIKVVDTSIVDATTGPDGSWLGWNDFTDTSVTSNFETNNYRQGVCSGYKAISHYMLSAWDTNAGQRIGSALEIEGVSGIIDPGVVKPKPPADLFVK